MDPQDLNELRSVEELSSHQGEVQARITEIVNEANGLPLTEEAREEVGELKERYDEIDKRVKEQEGLKALVERVSGNDRNVEKPEEAFPAYPKASMKERDIYDLSSVRHVMDDPEKAKGELRDRALRATEIAVFPHTRASREECQDHVAHLIETSQQATPGAMARHILNTGSPAYRRAFGKSLIGQSLSGEEQRALSLAGAGGGFAIPFALDPSIIPTSNSVVNPTRALARIESIVGSNTWQGVSSGAITATRQAEAAAVTDAAPTLAQPTATVTKAQAFVPFSIEVEGDWGAMESEMATLFADAKDDDEGVQFVTGVGTTVFPQGFVTGTTVTVAAATGLTVTAANIYALEAALPPRFRMTHSFVANRGIYNVVRGIDTAGGAALWMYISEGLVTQAPTPGNTGATLLGRGAWEASAMQATVVNATKIMVVGDFRYFLIVDRIGMNVELVPHLFGAAQGNLPTGQRGLLAYWRNTSKVLSASAFVALTGTT